MLKKLIITLLIALMSAFCAMPALAQVDLNDEEAVMAALGKEPALTQTDIDNFINHFPALNAAADADDDAALFALAKEIGWSEIRTIYVPLKIGGAWALSEDPESAAIIQALFPPEMMPNNDEIALVAQNKEKLAPLFEETAE